MYQAVRLSIGLVASVALVIVTVVFVKPWADADAVGGVRVKLIGAAATLPLLGFALWGFKRDEAGCFGGGNRRPPIDQDQQANTGTGRPGF